MAGEHAGHRQRMRERFQSQGLDGFAAHEALELILFYAIPQRNVNPLAHRLADRFGSFNAVLDASYEDLLKVDGMGEYAATLIKLFAAASRRYAQNLTPERKEIRNRLDAERHCVALLQGLRQEHFYAVLLDTQMRLIRDELISRGTVDEVPAYPRLVVEAALRHNASAVVLCHNHPTGSVIPSQQDVDMTNRLGHVLGGIGVTLIDHLVVAGGDCLSMLQHGLIIQPETNAEELGRAADPRGEVRLENAIRKRTKGQK